MNKYLRKYLVYIMWIYCFLTEQAYATTYKDDPIGVTLCTLLYQNFDPNNRAVPILSAIAIAGVIATAIQFMRGKISWQISLMIAVGIIIMFNAVPILRDWFIPMILGGKKSNFCER